MNHNEELRLLRDFYWGVVHGTDDSDDLIWEVVGPIWDYYAEHGLPLYLKAKRA